MKAIRVKQFGGTEVITVTFPGEPPSTIVVTDFSFVGE